MVTIPNLKRKKLDVSVLLTSVDFYDILELTLPHNKEIFKHFLVITSTQDGNTQAVCKNLNVDCIATDAFGERFNKGAAINEGLNQLQDAADWVLITDADIFWPPFLEKQLLSLNYDYLYGFYRRVLMKKDLGMSVWKFNDIPDFMEDINTLYLGGNYKYMATQEDIEIQSPFNGREVMRTPNIYKIVEEPEAFKAMGWNSDVESTIENPLPLGYGQLYNIKQYPNRRYPDVFDTAAGCDSYFSSQWLTEQRQFIKGFTTLHLGPRMVHWSGRKQGI